jgi:predicted amidohydrolase
MRPIVVAAIQLRWQRVQSEEALRGMLSRFLRMARDKGATVALLPEMAGLLLAAPLSQQIQTPTQKGGFWERLRGSFGGTPELADLLPTLITEHSDLLVERYVALFSELAREFALVLVAGSLLASNERGVIEYRSAVFDSDGGLLGWQPKFFLSDREQGFASGGQVLHYFDSSVGRLGVLLGNDILIPALVQHLARVGCVGVLNPTLARQADDWQRQQIVARARAQENQFYLAQAYLVGEDDLFAGPRRSLEGRSNVLAPVELTPRRDGVLSMVGAEKVEGVVTGEWGLAALQNLAETSEFPVKGAPALALPAMDEALPPRLLAPEEETPALTDTPQPALNAPPRTEPVVDPETGYYLGERAADSPTEDDSTADEAWAEVLRDAEEQAAASAEDESTAPG